MSQIRVIDNRGPNTCLRSFQHIARAAAEVNVAVPFIDSTGLRLVKPDLIRIARDGRVRVLVGVSRDAFNDPDSLQSLLALQESNQKRFEVRVSKFADRFHEKLYLARDGQSLRAIIGSSNLTAKGLSSPSEMNLEIIGGQDTQPLRELWSYFDTSFRTNAVPLNPSIIAIYRKLANQIHARAKGKKSGRLWARLRAQLGSQALGSAEHARNTWFDMITGDLSKAVEARVKEETIWTGDYYSCGSKKVYEKIEPGDFLMLIKKIRNGRSFTANRVTDKTRVHTPQGDYFVAYKPQGHWRRWTFETANLARRASIPIPSEHGQARLLTREQSEMLRKGEFITKDRTNDGIYQKSFQRKLLRCDSPTKKVAYALNRFITSLNRGVVYYPGGNDVRYTHEDVPPKKNGDRHPFVHISPQIKKLAVHVDEKVKVPKNVDYVHRRNARSSFKLWFDVGGENLLNRVRRDLIQQSFRLFIKRYDLSP